MKMSGSMPFPMTPSFMVTWSYWITGAKAFKVADAFGFSSNSGTVMIHISTPSESDYV